MDLYRLYLDGKEIFNTTNKQAVKQAMSVLSGMYDVDYEKEGNDYVLYRKNSAEV